MGNKYFPIHTDTACQLKWNWSTVRLYYGYSGSCHRVEGNIITPETFNTFHNTPKQLDDRRLMLEGKWPTGGCEYCKNIEEAGGSSDRTLQLSVPNQVPPELDDDPTAINVTPTIIEVLFDNICNMSCLYCWDGSSSKIQMENQKFGIFEQHGIVIKNTGPKVPDLPKLKKAFWDWLEINHKVLKRFHFLGGEPFFQKEFDLLIDFFNQHPCPDLEFNIVSNLMIEPSRFAKQISTIEQLVTDKKIKRFDLTASIDCFGPEQEYVRYGLDLDIWRNNFKYVVDKKWVVLNINQTFSNLTIKTSADMLKWIKPLRQNREIGQSFSIASHTHDFLHPKIFGPGFFNQDFENMYNSMPSGGWNNLTTNYLQGIQQDLNRSVRQPAKITQLTIYLDEMDRRRKTNWKKTFPWLEKELDNVV